jgi:hypothetical protein
MRREHRAPSRLYFSSRPPHQCKRGCSPIAGALEERLSILFDKGLQGSGGKEPRLLALPPRRAFSRLKFAPYSRPSVAVQRTKGSSLSNGGRLCPGHSPPQCLVARLARSFSTGPRSRPRPHRLRAARSVPPVLVAVRQVAAVLGRRGHGRALQAAAFVNTVCWSR